LETDVVSNSVFPDEITPFFVELHDTNKNKIKKLVIAGLTRNPLKMELRLRGDPVSSTG
jgi:hypothetical protein